MHRQEIRMASIKMVIKTSLQNNVRKLYVSSQLFYSRILCCSQGSSLYGHNSLFGHTKQSSVRRTEDSSVYPFYLLFKVLSVRFKNLGFSQVGILSWGKLRTPNSYIDFSVPRNCCEGEAKSVCYGRVLMASDAFCQKGWNNLNCCVGNGSKC